jgi:low temperature requirement protein LtrA
VRMLDRGMLRARNRGEQKVTPLELFFDLVYVYAITQLSHLLLGHPTVGGALETLFLLLVVWWAWQYTAWFTNWFDPEALPVRLMLVAVMLASLVMSVAIPGAIGEQGLMFALAYVAIQVGRTGFAVVALAGSPGASDRTSRDLAMTFRRILCWFAAAGVLWVAGACSKAGRATRCGCSPWPSTTPARLPTTRRRCWAARARRSGPSRAGTSLSAASYSSSSPWGSLSW